MAAVAGTRMEFGFCPFPLDLGVADVRFETLEGLDGVVRDVTSAELVENDWFFAPRRFRTDGTETPRPARVFGLPKTHRVTSPLPNDEERLAFLVECLGFLSGMRFTTTEAGFLDCTPIRRFVSGDFYCDGNDLQWALECCLETHRLSSQPRNAMALRGVIHSLQMSERRTLLDFERFYFLYTTLEGCHFVSETWAGQEPRRTSHGERLGKLCAALEITFPEWARERADPQGKFPEMYVLDRRNELIHDGLFFDAPLGFSVFGHTQNAPDTQKGGKILLAMTALLTRIVVGLLGMKQADYVRTSYDTRFRYSLRRPAGS